MAESLEDLEERIQKVVEPAFRRRLLDRGLARGLVWEKGILPPEAPTFALSLTEDLIDYAFGLLGMTLRLRALDAAHPLLERAFLIAGEALESAIHRGEPGSSQGFHRVSAAVAFHLARYSARAFSMLPTDDEAANHSPTEVVLVHLLRRNFEQMHEAFTVWLLDDNNKDEEIAARLETDEDFGRDDAIHIVLTTSFMRGIALFDHALATGRSESAQEARNLLLLTAESGAELRMVNHWWTATLAAHLVDELWGLSFHEQLPVLPDDWGFGDSRWNQLRESYILRLRAYSKAAIELWPSQLDAAKRAVDLVDDLVVALPTSAGKTRIAELCIVRCLSNDQRVIYITPLRALSAQIERDLAETFVPLGFRVTSLYGSAGVQSADSDTLRNGKIVVATPEKLDFALRNDPTIIENVGLIVFDEGHMLGKGEREVRYETLVQRILTREDARSRRIVCLSALFPNPEDMKDLVEWIRQDEPGEPVHSVWRPTRQRFGTIEGNKYGGGRLDISVGVERPFVPRFVERIDPPAGQRRKTPFPRDNQELTIGAAWRFVTQGKKVLVYCSQKRSVEPIGDRILDLIERGFLQSFVRDSKDLQNARTVGAEWLGEDHIAVKLLRYGVALHHGALPRQFLNEVEALLKSGACLLTIASPTLAQGLNLSASVLLVPSIWRNGEIVPTAEFANVAGRAGRAFVDLEGLILHLNWDKDSKRTREWNDLVAKAKAPMLKSGILSLAIEILVAIARARSTSPKDAMDYITGNSVAFEYSTIADEDGKIDEAEWERNIASLDAALLGMVDLDCKSGEIDTKLRDALKGSLFWRQGSQLKEGSLDVILAFLAARAGAIWAQTDESQRRGFFFAGIGLKTGLLISEELEKLLGFLYYAEQAINEGNGAKAANYLVGFAEIVFGFAPFHPYKGLPKNWKVGLRMWLSGDPSEAVIKTCGSEGVEFLQDGLVYRLPWSIEAVRVHCLAIGRIEEDQLSGIAALAVETGSLNKSVITLIRNGLSSREAAQHAVDSTNARFDDFEGMIDWLRSDEIFISSSVSDWPTERSRYSWLKFYESEERAQYREWKRETVRIDLEWLHESAMIGAHVVIERPESSGKGCRVLTPDYFLIGETKYDFNLEGLIDARIESNRQGLILDFYGEKGAP